LAALDKLTILSSSDAHSLPNIGREANVMELSARPTYQEIYDHIKNRTGLKMTLEFYPEEGMYHIDGHRACNFSCLPAESRKLKNICPVCHKPLVIGVLNRVEELADRPVGFRPPQAVPFKKLVELDKIIAEALNIKSRNSAAVQKQYQLLTKEFGSELFILLDLDLAKISKEVDFRIVAALRRVRAGELLIQPGFDGQYGRVDIFAADSRPDRQHNLF
jgi:PHP family Zn ribbon phosphoesterase